MHQSTSQSADREHFFTFSGHFHLNLVFNHFPASFKPGGKQKWGMYPQAPLSLPQQKKNNN